MQTISYEGRTEKVYTIDEVPLLLILLSVKRSKHRKVSYLEIPCAFDIECTNINDPVRPFAFMYHWQFCIGEYVVFGRTWTEFQYLLQSLERRLNLDARNQLVIWVHNLGYEFQFFRRFVNVTDGFFDAEYSPLKVTVETCIEFRDSYRLSNESLAKFCEHSGAQHNKLSGDNYDYDKLRTPLYQMSDAEQMYCYNDVRGLCECIAMRMKEDTLASMPMTSTGYVRRDCRVACKKNPENRKQFTRMALDSDTYKQCVAAFRGGDTHANLLWSNCLLHNVSSFDLVSAYPACIMNDDFPIDGFVPVKNSTFFNHDWTGYVYILSLRLSGVRYTGIEGNPYIPVSKCRLKGEFVSDNGRVLQADLLEITVTNYDLDIIKACYSFSDCWVNGVKVARAGKISPELRAVTMKYFRAKCELKKAVGMEYEYMKSKNRLNAIYGMTVTRIDRDRVTYNGREYERELVALDDALAAYYKGRNNFLSYQQGIFVTAHCRRRLREGMAITGRDLVYCDTDSVKCRGDHKQAFDDLNKRLRVQSEANGAVVSYGGKDYVMGLWEYEGTYDEFKTLGAKKYIYKQDGTYHSTISGVKKSVGQKYFTAHGIDAFKVGTCIEKSGHLVAYYNDDDIHTITVDNVDILTASNVALIDGSYTIGITDEYADLLEKYSNKARSFY